MTSRPGDASGPRSAATPLAHRDFYAGALLFLIGLGVLARGSSYHVGTLMRMGPGFLPAVLGAMLAAIGVMIAAATFKLRNSVATMRSVLPARDEWRGWGCILASPLAFIFFGSYFGLAPAVFACAFVAALGDRDSRLKGAALLAAGLTVFGVVLFAFLLGIPMPLLQWSGL